MGAGGGPEGTAWRGGGHFWPFKSFTLLGLAALRSTRFPAWAAKACAFSSLSLFFFYSPLVVSDPLLAWGLLTPGGGLCVCVSSCQAAKIVLLSSANFYDFSAHLLVLGSTVNRTPGCSSASRSSSLLRSFFGKLFLPKKHAYLKG